MNIELIKQEVRFKAVRSGKPGGQHVNKVASKIQLYFDINQSKALTNEEKARVLEKIAKRINNQGVLILSVETSKSQHTNKKQAVHNLIVLLERALSMPKKRKKTKPSKAAVYKRLQRKKQHAEKKKRRKTDYL